MTARQDELVLLAETLIEEQGLDSFSLGSLARAAKIRTPSLYKHFSSLTALEHVIISRAFVRLSTTLDRALGTEKSLPTDSALAKLAAAYRAHAFARPQIYRLMTERPLNRALLIPGSEQAAMTSLLKYFDESPQQHDKARAAWAGAHGLVSLELSGRFPAGTDISGAWEVFMNAFSPTVKPAGPRF